MPRPVVLIILDGWGVAPPSRRNAVTLANTPAFDSFTCEYLTATIRAAGEAVGLPWGEQGNSEVGHTNIGVGRIVYQDLQTINHAISDGSFFENPAFQKALSHAKTHRSSLHLVGLLSRGGVHASLDHLFALLDCVLKHDVPQTWIHGILDGRDSQYNSGLQLIREIQMRIRHQPKVILSSLVGRFFAMDRDRHWDRIEQGYRAITEGKGVMVAGLESAVEEQYRLGVFDENMPAFVEKSYSGVRENDAMIFFNFRADRARQLTRAFVVPGFVEFSRTVVPQVFVTMTQYEKNLPVEVAFPQSSITHPLCELVSEAGMKQFHIAETEKYAHVTYFLNGGKEEPFSGQVNVLIPSLTVSSYDETPSMRAPDIAARVVEELIKGEYGFYAVNFANADMVGHTGNMQATIRAIEILDRCIRDITEAARAQDGVVLITADHGNAEELAKAQTGEVDKEHSDAPVPLLIIGKEYRKHQEGRGEGGQEKQDLSLLVPSGVLADVAPTILKIMGIAKPKEMTGRSLV